MKTQETGVVTIKNERDEIVGIIHKDGANAPVVYMTEVAGVEGLVELFKPTTAFIRPPLVDDEAHDNEGDGR